MAISYGTAGVKAFGNQAAEMAAIMKDLPSEIAGSILDTALLAGARSLANDMRRASPGAFTSRTGRLRKSIKGAGYVGARRRRTASGRLRWTRSQQPRVVFGGPGARQANILEFGREGRTNSRGGAIRPRLLLTRSLESATRQRAVLEAISSRMAKDLAGVAGGVISRNAQARVRRAARRAF